MSVTGPGGNAGAPGPGRVGQVPGQAWGRPSSVGGSLHCAAGRPRRGDRRDAGGEPGTVNREPLPTPVESANSDGHGRHASSRKGGVTRRLGHRGSASHEGSRTSFCQSRTEGLAPLSRHLTGRCCCQLQMISEVARATSALAAFCVTFAAERHSLGGAPIATLSGPPVSSTRLRVGPWVAYAAAIWALVFAAFHIVWAAGWYPLLDAEQARVMFATPWKWAYDVVVAGMCIIAVPVALAPVRSWGQRVPQRLNYVLAWIGSALLILRSVASLLQAGYLAATDRFRFVDMGVWEPWFYLGAILFGLSTWRSRRVGKGEGTT